MRVLLIRHGEALGDPFPEVLRPLSPKGRKKIRDLVRELVRLNVLADRIFSSPLPRAIQTAEILLAGLRKTCPVRTVEPRIELASDFLSWAFDRDSFLSVLAENLADAVIFVGHEPNLITLASWIDPDLSRFDVLTGIGKGTGLLLEWDPQVGGHYQGRISP